MELVCFEVNFSGGSPHGEEKVAEGRAVFRIVITSESPVPPSEIFASNNQGSRRRVTGPVTGIFDEAGSALS